jgi:hypothetical protein
MDGAVADGQGVPFPLICTTSEDVIGNLTRSLTSYLTKGGRRRHALVATSQELTQTQRRHLEERAQEKGFTLVQIYTQAAIADKLYRDAAWCRELLDLTGDPPPLSAVPPTQRPLLGEALIGREGDLDWVQHTRSDRILVGHPGSGKTFLLHALSKKVGGLFVVTNDPGRIATGIRTQQPNLLIVDDAHANLGLLAVLRHLRQELGAKFDIVASCWHGSQARVVEALSAPSQRVHTLELLSRDDIVAVIKGVGITGPQDLIREIVNQAEGKPGLAVTLAYLCLQGGTEEVAFGEALNRYVRTTFETLVGTRATALLAAFALGGKMGLSMESVASALGVPLIDVRHDVIFLAAGGVVVETPHDGLAVRPPELRYVLVRDTFFAGSTSIPIEPHLRFVRRPSDTALVLIGARARGATVPDELLVSLLEAAQTDAGWREYAWLGKQETLYVLSHCPSFLIAIAYPALHYAPQQAIPLLLNKACGDNRPLHSAPDHPLRLLEAWIEEAYPGIGEAIPRRRLLVIETSKWMASGGTVEIGVQALSLAISPNFERNSTDPGSGNTVTFTHGLLNVDEIEGVEEIWANVLSALRTSKDIDWTPILSALHDWVYPGSGLTRPISSEQHVKMLGVAGKIIRAIVPLIDDRPGILHRLSQLAEAVNIIPVPTPNRAFRILFPSRESPDWRTAEKKQVDAVRKLAAVWANKEPGWVAKRISAIEREAKIAQITWPRWTPLLCRELAEKTSSPSAWAHDMTLVGLEGELLEPFLVRSLAVRDNGWRELFHTSLSVPTAMPATVAALLTASEPPHDLLLEAICRAGELPRMVNTLCLRNQVPEATARLLLADTNDQVASSAALGIWSATPERTASVSDLEEWRAAVLRSDPEEYCLKEILTADHELANRWLERRLSEDHEYFPWVTDADRAAIGTLDVAARSRVIDRLPDKYWIRDMVGVLVGEDFGLFEKLLTKSNLHRYHLVPLESCKEETWPAFALVALDHGHAEEDVIAATYPSSFTWSGNESDLWQTWIDRFEKVCQHPNPRVRALAQAGRNRAEEERAAALKSERYRATYGIE